MSGFNLIRGREVGILHSSVLTGLAKGGFEALCEGHNLIRKNLSYECDMNFAVEMSRVYMNTLQLVKNLERPSVDHLVKVITRNGRVYNDAIITHLSGSKLMIMVQGGLSLTSSELGVNGLQGAFCGGYSAPVNIKELQLTDSTYKSYRFFPEGVRSGNAISLDVNMKRWLLDDSAGLNKFY